MDRLLATKIGMTRVFDNTGASVPVTVVKVESCWIVNKCTKEKNGYNAFVVGYGEKKEATKVWAGAFKDKKNGMLARKLKEFRIESGSLDEYEIGADILLDIFKPGDYVDVVGITKGKGYAGVIKRHGFHGLPHSHGHGEYRRAPGGMAASSDPSRVFKGKKLPGHMGAERHTVQKLEIFQVNTEERLILIKGSVPGVRNSNLLIKKTNKSKKERKIVEAKKK
ncbi:MAG: 50S ribosomal protein L3 [Elusimicrobiota bacterium]